MSPLPKLLGRHTMSRSYVYSLPLPLLPLQLCAVYLAIQCRCKKVEDKVFALALDLHIQMGLHYHPATH